MLRSTGICFTLHLQEHLIFFFYVFSDYRLLQQKIISLGFFFSDSNCSQSVTYCFSSGLLIIGKRPLLEEQHASHEAAAPLIKITASLGGNITLEEFADLHVFLLPSRQPSFSPSTTKPFFILPRCLRAHVQFVRRSSHHTTHLPHFLSLISDNQHTSTPSEVSRMST